MAQKLVSYEALKAKGITYSKPTLWRKEKAGEFPLRVPIVDLNLVIGITATLLSERSNPRARSRGG